MVYRGDCCFLIIRKPGVAILAELAAGAGETILSGELNMSIIMHSLAQGLACELIFLIFKYKSTKASVAMLAGATAGILPFLSIGSLII